MVITNDEDWYSYIQEVCRWSFIMNAIQLLSHWSQDMTMSSDPEQILTSILSLNDIREENGMYSNAKVYHSSPDAIQELYISNPKWLVR